MKTKYKSIFISDLHLGTRGCQYDRVLDLINSTQSENLFILGDFIDGWKLKKSKYWPQKHTDIVRKLLKRTKSNTCIHYIIGNHDEFLINFLGSLGDKITIEEEFIYESHNKKFILCHGHQFDYVIKHMKILGILGSIGYDSLIYINRKINQTRKKFNLTHWSLSKYVKDKVKNIVTFLSKYEKCLLDYVSQKKVDGIICGHLHQPCIDKKEENFYFNCGDWIENCTAIVEDYDGNFFLISYMYKEPTILKQINIKD